METIRDESSTTIAYNRHSDRSRRGMAAVAITLAVLPGLGCGKGEKPEEKSVDCRQNPSGTVAATIDARGNKAVVIGNAAIENGTRQWREKVTAQGRGNGEFSVAAGGYGPIVTYAALASQKREVELLRNSDTGSQISVKAGPTNNSSKSEPVIVTFHCQTDPKLPPMTVG